MGANVKTRVPGSVWQVLVKPGDQVTEGEVLFILEVMKTEVPHAAPVAGRVDAVRLAEGDSVEGDVIAIVLK